jgi:benzodiazapine receptor
MSLGLLMASVKLVALQVGNLLAFVVTLIVNGLANTLILGGRTTGSVSDLYPTLITPAGYVFAIWGIIYTLLMFFVVYQVLPKQREKSFLTQVSFLFILSCILNVIWIFLWQYDYITLTVVPMFALLATLIAIYIRLKVGKSKVSLKEKAFVHLPFSVYFGWITVATAADVAAALYASGWVRWSPADAIWGIVAMVAVLIVTLAIVAARKDYAYGLVAVWALVGIAVKQSAVPEIALTAEVGAFIASITIIGVAVYSKLKK